MCATYYERINYKGNGCYLETYFVRIVHEKGMLGCEFVMMVLTMEKKIAVVCKLVIVGSVIGREWLFL